MFDKRLVAGVCAAAGLLLQAAAPAAADQMRDDQWHLDYLDIAAAHETAQGEGITVAVIDSGVAVHEDLDGNVLAGIDLIEGATGDGQEDVDGHGTAMAALIAAHGHGPGGADGALGVAPAAKILPIRNIVDNPDDPLATVDAGQVEADDQKLADAIRWAVDQGARIISISEGWGSGAIEVGQAVDEARGAGVLIFAAAGNVAQLDREVIVPAALNWVVAVGATTPDGGHWDGGVAGTEVELSAPGEDLVSLAEDGSSRRASGSSGSTAIVSGVAALVWSAHPELSARDVLYRLEATATDAGAPGRDPEFGFGIVDPVAALTADLEPLPGSAADDAPPEDTTPESPSAGDDTGTEVAAPGGSEGGGGLSGGSIVLLCAGLLTVLGVVALAVRGGTVAAPAGAPPVAPGAAPDLGTPAGGFPGARTAPAPPRRRAYTLLAIAAVAVVAGGGYALVQSGDDAGSGVGTGDGEGDAGGGRAVTADLPASANAAVEEFIAALQAQNCDRALELETEESWSRYGSLTREQAIGNCQSDATAYLGTGATIKPPDMFDESDEEASASVDVVDAAGTRHTLFIPVVASDGGWQVNAFPSDPEAAGYLLVITPDLPSGPVETIDTSLHIPAENATPESCLQPTTPTAFARCYDDQATQMFTT